ncbi:MAG: AAA family ATPase [Bacteroidales bacterium]|jgi:predicted AAA+ superfamily ATPase|nr:AAA family ATPase [Bacteroidales bacterium]MDD4217942.1 AAA family ATPase [Bacteroidales bacterium]MDY0140405.1 AAA family ATPase [Bacteroidales bacterium]
MEDLYAVSNKLINIVKTDFYRSLFEDIDWNQRLIEIRGSRGVGKTTLMLQKAKEYHNFNSQSVLYVSLDDSYFYNHSIKETAIQFSQYGGQYLFIDEVHKYPEKYKAYDWSSEIKNIYDQIPELKIVYSGSSIIQLYKGNGDLSRRRSTYNLNGLSFREYLSMNKIQNFNSLTTEEIIIGHVDIANQIIVKIKILPHFQNYIKHGYYPFYLENPKQYYQRIKNIVNLILEIDIPSVTDISFETINKIKKLLAAISSTVPYTPNLTRLSSNLNISDLRTLYNYLGFLENAELISLLRADATGNKILQKPEKIFPDNTNLIYALNQTNAKIGLIRETFFNNQLSYSDVVNYPKIGDFIVNNNYTIEVGGKNKDSKQLKNINNSYFALDNIEIGFGNTIPLWLFGFLY